MRLAERIAAGVRDSERTIAVLHELDLSGTEPELRFDASWREEDR